MESREATREFVLRDPAALGLPEVDAALEQWERNGQMDALFEVSPDWWARMQTVSLGDRTFYIGALVREADFAERTLQVRNQLLAISLLGVLLAVLVGIVVDQAFQRRLREEVARARKIGQYTLEQRIGAGGMGEVYRARHAMLRRPTAVKLMVGRSSPEAVARFEREVQRTAELTHPNTIAIYDYGRTPEDVFYYAMEYVEGLDLDGLMAAGGPISPAQVVHLLVQVCGSLAEAHAAGLVHRDIKPANVMLCRRGGRFDVVKVLDFGLVAELAEDGDVSLMRGTPVSTPRYIAPECLQPGRRIDGRADLYAVGAIGVYLLTGRHAVSGETVAQIWAAHLKDEPLRPSSVRATPADLERVLLWCLRKNPAERPASAEELANALTQCAVAGGWTDRDAEAWWGERGEMPGPVIEVQDTEQTFSISVFLDDREEQTSGAGESRVQG